MVLFSISSKDIKIPFRIHLSKFYKKKERKEKEGRKEGKGPPSLTIKQKWTTTRIAMEFL
jgi:hypothetical protein